ncbi:hypothetical protein GCM10007874_72180 [Labrys miyagiensis]|uniref:Uncharacterized protein n=1 Tax=Labrys miyagiensis TaxID=346912 RepID=A0ABQ6CV24_9HYPH|nr:hypothetical protein GCM10007874_72180 [Labrys miyagiensis]
MPPSLVFVTAPLELGVLFGSLATLIDLPSLEAVFRNNPVAAAITFGDSGRNDRPGFYGSNGAFTLADGLL